MSIEETHACKMKCDTCGDTFYEGTMVVDPDGYVRNPSAHSVTVWQGHLRADFLLCPGCWTQRRKDVVAQLPGLPWEDDPDPRLKICFDAAEGKELS